MPSYTEGTRAWAEQMRDQAYHQALRLLEQNGFSADGWGELPRLQATSWVHRSTKSEAEAIDDWDAYRMLLTEHGAMQEYVEQPPVADDGLIFYTAAELEADGQRRLFA